MPDVTVSYHHQLTALTVGQLRVAIADLPDDWAVIVSTAGTSGGQYSEEQVAFAAHQITEIRDGVEQGRPELCIEADYPAGTYERSEWRD